MVLLYIRGRISEGREGRERRRLLVEISLWLGEVEIRGQILEPGSEEEGERE